MLKTKLIPKLILFFIIVLALALRLYGINWDQGHHLHPDERMLIMVAGRIHFFDQLNPNFFNYGSLPIYLLSGTSQFLDYAFKTHLNNYDGMLYVGRILSVLADTLTVLLIYKITLTLFKDKKIAALASFFYAVSFFPIQNAHFFTVDVFLNLFAASLILALLLYLKKPSLKKVLAISIISALITATKLTGIIFLPVVFLVLIYPIAKKPFVKHLTDSLKNLTFFIFHFSFFIFLFMPYAFIEHKKFLSDVMLQIKMNSDPFIFPYTLQFVGTTPYLYYLKNIFLWGLGPIISSMAVIGLIIGVIKLVGKLRVKSCELRVKSKNLFSKSLYFAISLFRYFQKFILFALFYILYFIIIGKSAVKFMRYMLPLYPVFAILAGFGFNFIHQKSRLIAGSFAGTLANVGLLDPSSNQFTSQKNIVVKYFKGGVDQVRLGITCFLTSVNVLIIILTVGWSLMFISIYSRPHTRISASKWIYENVPDGATLAVEHWDDRLPLSLSRNTAIGRDAPAGRLYRSPDIYHFEELALYEPDTPGKWERINQQLAQTDYLIIASNRLYTPLTRLTDCTQLPPGRCYLQTAKYYQNLFAGKLEFVKIAEFTSYPKLNIPITNYQLLITDDSADESFTVYDHPKVMVFKNTQK